MKEHRIKKNKEVMKILLSNSFREPYQIIVDHSFIAMANKVQNPLKQIDNLFKSMPKFFVTKCEYAKYNKEHKQKDNDFSGQCQIMSCFHEEECAVCIEDVIKDKNRNHYILGSANKELIDMFRDKTNVPILKIKKSVFYLDLGKLEMKKRPIHGKAASAGEIERLKKMYG
ncbi:U3 small nucleolar RNA-associated protein 23 [Enteropsectra breve]|nr:U3 small nucleolar RNA-associated protein 23 [Enteropsectra breve]